MGLALKDLRCLFLTHRSRKVAVAIVILDVNILPFLFFIVVGPMPSMTSIILTKCDNGKYLKITSTCISFGDIYLFSSDIIGLLLFKKIWFCTNGGFKSNSLLVITKRK